MGRLRRCMKARIARLKSTSSKGEGATAPNGTPPPRARASHEVAGLCAWTEEVNLRRAISECGRRHNVAMSPWTLVTTHEQSPDKEK